MAEWTTPKTDWTESDYFNAQDYNRIMNNILFLKDFAFKLFGEFELEEMDGNKSYYSLIFARNLNAIEDNLDAINQNTYMLPIGTKMSFSPNGNTPLFSEYNRIEQGLWQLHQWLVSNASIEPYMAFTLGGEKIKGIKRTKYRKQETIGYRLSIDLGLERGFRP